MCKDVLRVYLLHFSLQTVPSINLFTYICAFIFFLCNPGKCKNNDIFTSRNTLFPLSLILFSSLFPPPAE